MELAIPLIALGGLYVVSKQQRNENELDMTTEGFEDLLPNTNIPNKNYPRSFISMYAKCDQVSRAGVESQTS